MLVKIIKPWHAVSVRQYGTEVELPVDQALYGIKIGCAVAVKAEDEPEKRKPGRPGRK